MEKTFATRSGEYVVMEPHEADPMQITRHGQVHWLLRRSAVPALLE